MHPAVPGGTSQLTDTLGLGPASLVAPDEGGAVCATTAVDAKTVAAKTPKTRRARRSHAISRLDVARTGRCLGCYRHRRLRSNVSHASAPEPDVYAHIPIACKISRRLIGSLVESAPWGS